ncbi:hypothetical protein [Blattabacterium cuenoti]|uniref:hypothetical protein n=1 Tax=Blattabacterium cuenoti TaxID=1653831 RepID=UPI00163BBEC5|nr:hypothetical protein [Blattabacterium cuenoti]
MDKKNKKIVLAIKMVKLETKSSYRFISKILIKDEAINFLSKSTCKKKLNINEKDKK